MSRANKVSKVLTFGVSLPRGTKKIRPQGFQGLIFLRLSIDGLNFNL